MKYFRLLSTKSSRIFTFISLFSLFSLVASGKGEEPGGFNELFENGNPRPQYEKIISSINRTKEETIKKLEKKSYFLFMKDNTMAPFPRLITVSEAQTIEEGSKQRARAFQLFLEDYTKDNWKNFEHIISKETLQQILVRNKEHVYKNSLNVLNSETIAFPYGADIIRDSTNTWRVIEDNIGYIGGPGDINKAREVIIKLQSGLMKKINVIDNTQGFYDGIARNLKQIGANIPNGVPVMLSFPPFPDNEDVRLQSELKKVGVQPITPKSNTKLVVVPGKGVFFKSKDSEELQRVNSIFVNTEFETLDPSHPLVIKRNLLRVAEEKINSPHIKAERKISLAALLKLKQDDSFFKKLEFILEDEFKQFVRKEALQNTHYPGLLDEYFAGRVALNYTPGVDFLGDKEFYFYVEDLIRYYLKEEPIIKNIESIRFAKTLNGSSPVLDQEIFDKVFLNQKEWVIKSFDGRGGDAVWVGAKITPEKFAEAKAKVIAEPTRYLAQKYTPLSTFQDLIVDLRQISYVNSKDIFVSKTKWGRGIPSSGDGKVNISSSGREMAIVIVPDPNICNSTKIKKISELLQ